MNMIVAYKDNKKKAEVETIVYIYFFVLLLKESD